VTEKLWKVMLGKLKLTAFGRCTEQHLCSLMDAVSLSLPGRLGVDTDVIYCATTRHISLGMLIFENLNSRYENFNSRDSTSSRIPDALTDHVLKASQVRS